MSEPKNWNKAIIEEFRANKGKVGGFFASMNLLLLHTTGAKSGLPRLNPAAYLEAGDKLAIFASKAGAPTNPDWYHISWPTHKSPWKWAKIRLKPWQQSLRSLSEPGYMIRWLR